MELFQNGKLIGAAQIQAPVFVDTHVSDYTIVHLCKSPSMNVEKHSFRGTFAEAVEACRAKFVELLPLKGYDVKCVRVCDRHGIHAYFKVETIMGDVRETNLNGEHAQYRRVEGAES